MFADSGGWVLSVPKRAMLIHKSESSIQITLAKASGAAGEEVEVDALGIYSEVCPGSK